MPEEGGEERRWRKTAGVRRRGAERMGEVRIVDGGEKKKVGVFPSFFPPVFIINSAALELRRSWARDSCEEEEKRFLKWPTNREGGEPCCDG